jgi:predicted nucleic acid-binding protein
MASRAIVVDSSVAVKWFLSETQSAEALNILGGFMSDDLSLLAPDFIYAELGNVMWQRVRRNMLSAVDAQEFVSKISNLRFALTSSSDLLVDACELAIAHGRSVYDSLYLALSLRENCALVTADIKFADAVSKTYPNVVPLATWS